MVLENLLHQNSVVHFQFNFVCFYLFGFGFGFGFYRTVITHISSLNETMNKDGRTEYQQFVELCV